MVHIGFIYPRGKKYNPKNCVVLLVYQMSDKGLLERAGVL